MSDKRFFTSKANKRSLAAQHNNQPMSLPTPSGLYLPPSVQLPLLSGLPVISRGKVRILYDLPNHPHLALVVTTDQVSVFDEVMPWLVPNKGYSLNFLSIWWKKQMDQELKDVPHDLVAWGAGIDRYLPEHLRGDDDLHMRATVVLKLDMVDAEMVFRRRITGSAWKDYSKKGKRVFSGQTLPDGLTEWSDLGYPFFNPTTKNPGGHDEEMLVSEFRNRFGPIPQMACTKVFNFCAKIAESKGICYADGKFEGGKDPEKRFRLGDEAPTPDSSRFVVIDELERAIRDGNTPASLDKQPVRNHCSSELGIDGKTVFDEATRERIASAPVPSEVIGQMSQNYPALFKMFSGYDLDSYLRTHAGKE